MALAASLCLAASAAAGPRLEVRPERMDFGSIKRGEKKQKTVRLYNAGDARLVIEQIRPSCAECVVDKVPTEPLDPGQEFSLPVTYLAAALPGTYTAHLTLHTNDPAEPLKRVYLDAASGKPKPFVTPGSPLGRNDPCPCGSGKKYKKCCLGLLDS